MFDFTCPEGHTFEDLVSSDTKSLKCKSCDKEATRQISPARIDWRGMGVTKDFPTCSQKWDKSQRKKAKSDKQDGPNLWMY